MVSCSGWAHDCVAAFSVSLFMMWLHCVILNEIHVHRQRFVKAWCYFRRFRCGSITHMWCKQNAEYICCLSHLFSFFLYTGKTLNRWDWRACDFWTQSTLMLQSYWRFYIFGIFRAFHWQTSVETVWYTLQIPKCVPKIHSYILILQRQTVTVLNKLWSLMWKFNDI